MPTTHRMLQWTPRLLRRGSLAVRLQVPLCVLGAKAVQCGGSRLVQVRAALQRSVQTDASASRARRRCIAAALLCTGAGYAMKNGGWLARRSAVGCWRIE
ncbi:hypothetical protein Bphy_2250 [Paraburkholderia phymatum STM815]|uniref:Uncharacterized protein n=1 Tax=Paraburkholderia phymatum (strain DSM 17167 / CIP 108236 / LMG 21445 / STM815) TaxID=391038 RepID=B2JF57_PARP8|nr:hypothetical protein Bphy_2250 [Paraburkholderia phymatum STM815]